MTRQHVVYLSGPIQGCTDAECAAWRDEARRRLRCAALSPLHDDYRGKSKGNEAAIVRKDLDLIDRCGIVLANFGALEHACVGTSMEVFYANSQGCLVVAVVDPGAEPSAWLVHHADVILPSLDLAIDFLNALVKVNP